MGQISVIISRNAGSALSANQQGGQNADAFSASFILGGQVKGGEPRLFLIYPEGNFIESSEDTPFFQIGETKYGKPILIRAYDPDMSFSQATKLLAISFDSTIRSNLSVGMPLDMTFYERDSLSLGYRARLEQDDPYYKEVSERWSEALRDTFNVLPDYPL